MDQESFKQCPTHVTRPKDFICLGKGCMQSGFICGRCIQNHDRHRKCCKSVEDWAEELKKGRERIQDFKHKYVKEFSIILKRLGEQLNQFSDDLTSFYLFDNNFVNRLEKLEFANETIMTKIYIFLSSFNRCKGETCSLDFELLEQNLEDKKNYLVDLETQLRDRLSFNHSDHL